MRRLADWISDGVNDSKIVRYVVVPLVLAYTVPLVLFASILHGFSLRTKRRKYGPERDHQMAGR